MDDEDDGTMDCLLPYNGYQYVSRCTDGPQSLRTVWKCAKPGCDGQMTTVLVHSDSTLDVGVVLFSSSLGKRIFSILDQKEHDHPATDAVHGVMTSNNAEKTKLKLIDLIKSRKREKDFNKVTTSYTNDFEGANESVQEVVHSKDSVMTSNTAEKTKSKHIDPNKCGSRKRNFKKIESTSYTNGFKRADENVQDVVNSKDIVITSNIVEKTRLKPVDSNKCSSINRDLKMITTSDTNGINCANENVEEVLSSENNNQQKAGHVKWFQCKTCFELIVLNNYAQHLKTVSHQLSIHYLQNKYVIFNRKPDIDCIVSCRILSPEHQRIDDFLILIKSNVLDFVNSVIQFGKSKFIKVEITMFALYDDDIHVKGKLDTLGIVKTFMVKGETISMNTILSNWFQRVSDKLMSENLNFLKSQKSKFLSRILFLDIIFKEVTYVVD